MSRSSTSPGITMFTQIMVFCLQWNEDMDPSIWGVNWRYFAYSNCRRALPQSTRQWTLIAPISCKHQEEGRMLISLGIRSCACTQHTGLTADHLMWLFLAQFNFQSNFSECWRWRMAPPLLIVPCWAINQYWLWTKVSSSSLARWQQP